MLKQFLFILSASIFLSCQGQQIKKLAPKSFEEALLAYKSKNLLDVRTPEEYANGRIQGSENLDWNGADFEEVIVRYDRNTPLFIYCLSGGRSGNAARRAKELGFKNIIELEGGMMAWRNENMPEQKEKMATSMTMKDYEALFKDKKKNILIDFYAEWCMPCQKMKPYLEKIGKEKSNHLEIIRINADEHPQLCKELKVEGLPLLIFYEKGVEKWKRMGYMSEDELRKSVSMH